MNDFDQMITETVEELGIDFLKFNVDLSILSDKIHTFCGTEGFETDKELETWNRLAYAARDLSTRLMKIELLTRKEE